MRIISVNIGIKRPNPTGRSGSFTGIYKIPHTGPVDLQPLGLSGDVICSGKHHGGPDQAVYIYGMDDYEYWNHELGYEIEPGAFGENLTISELASASFSIGDRLMTTAVTLEVTAPRIPCNTFAARMGDEGWIAKFRSAGRPGLYCRVLQPGVIQAGDEVRLEPYSQSSVTILEMFHEFYKREASREGLQRYLDAPIAIRDRLEKEKRLKML